MKITAGGSITTSGTWLIGHGGGGSGAFGALWMEEGATATSNDGFKIANDTDAWLGMTGGEINVSSYFIIGRASPSGFSTGVVHLDGGTIDAAELRFKGVASGSVVAGSYLDITGGVMTIGVVTIPGSGIPSQTFIGAAAVTQLEEWVTSGYITAYGGIALTPEFPLTPTPTWAEVIIELDAVTGLITLSAIGTPPPPVPGDANLDGKVDIIDLGALAGHYGTLTDMLWEDGDFSDDGAVDIIDLGILAGNYGYGVDALNFENDMASLGLVPEPASMALLALGGLGLIRRRR